MQKQKLTKKQKNKLDREWRQAIKERDKFCQVCGPGVEHKVLNAHHLIPKQFIKFRWDLRNGMMLCFQHHSLGRYSAHQHPVWFAQWLRINRPEIFEWIVMRMELDVR